MTSRTGSPRRATIVVAVLSAFVGAVGPLTTGAEAANAAPPTVVALNAPLLGSPPATSPAVVALTLTAGGYDVLRANGDVDTFGLPPHATRTPVEPVGASATGLAADPATGGYWTVSSNGVVHAVNAPFLGQPRIPAGGWGQFPAAVALAAAPDGAGYYVLRANGVVDAFGRSLHGSSAARLPYYKTAPVVAVALALDPATGGYWIATSNGAVVAVNAPNDGSPLARAHGHYRGAPVTALAAAPDGSGYEVLFGNGVIDAFGTMNRPTAPLVVSDGAVADALALTSSGGAYVGIDASAHDGYLNPLRDVTALVPQEIDQGVDYCGSGPVYALGNAVVVNLYEPGWPSGIFISYRLLTGPGKGRYVYVAENVTPLVSVGERVTSDTVLGIVHDAKTCLETGWADAPATPERAAAHLFYNGSNSTAYGLNFSALLSSLGARPGLPQHHGAPGSLATGWPTW